jgi:hypothetical protein
MKTVATLLLCSTLSLAAPKTLYGIPWHDSVPDAVKASKGKKPVLWLRMLGDLACKT